jgi:hypothetical protein
MHDISTANGTKRRRYDPNADQSLVTSRALIVVVPQPGRLLSATSACEHVICVVVGGDCDDDNVAAPVRRSTAADVLFELQSLFATLQMSHSGAISTRALTDSFGWRSSQAVQQQDVHELNRMLFDVIERALRRTPQAKLVQQLYGGATTTSLRCEVCNTERRRADASARSAALAARRADRARGAGDCVRLGATHREQSPDVRRVQCAPGHDALGAPRPILVDAAVESGAAATERRRAC